MIPNARVLLGLTVGLLFFGLFAPRLHEFSRGWFADEGESHAPLIPVLSGLLVWRQLRRHGWHNSGNAPAGVARMALGGVLHLAAVVFAVTFLDLLALVALLNGLAVLLGGRQGAARLRFPILFLVFMFPLPNLLAYRLSAWLQDTTASLAVGLLQLFVPVHRAGYMLFFPGHELEIGAACSGVRQALVFFALALLLGHVRERSTRVRLGLVMSALPVAVAANVLRVLVMALVLRVLGPGWLEGPFHSVWGLLTMALGLGLLWIVDCWLTRLFVEAIKRPTPSPANQAPGGLAALSNAPLLFAAAWLGLLLFGQRALQAHLDVAAPELPSVAAAFPERFADWRVHDEPARRVTALQQTDVTLQRTYVPDGTTTSDASACDLVVLHTLDGHDRDHHPLVCYQAAGWREETAARAQVLVDDGGVPIRRFCFTADSRKTHVYYWHYTLEPEPATGASFWLWLRRHSYRRWPSVTVEVFTAARSPEQLRHVEEFVRQVDRELRATLLPAGARRGSDTAPVVLVGAGAVEKVERIPD